jgi:hypothetical protein
MAHHEHNHDRGRQVGWGQGQDQDQDQGNGYRRQFGEGRMGRSGGSASWDQGEYGGMGTREGEGEYGGQGFWAQGEFPGQQRTQYEPQGYGEDYMAQGVGFQGRERYAQGAQTRTHVVSRDDQRYAPQGGYGENYGRMPERSQGWESSGQRGYRPGQQQSSSGRGQGYGGWEQQSGDQGFWDEGRSGQWGDPGRSSGSQRGSMTGGGRGADLGYSSAGSWMSGPHSRRGPRNYQRADARIEEDACEALYHHGHIDASNIDVSVQNGEITLTGTVETRQEKRLAEDILESISGVKDITNQLRVQSNQGQGQFMNASNQPNVQGSLTQMAGEASEQIQTSGQRGRQSQRKETAVAGTNNS